MRPEQQARRRSIYEVNQAGKISHEQAARKAEAEFAKFHCAQLAQPSQVEKDFDAAVKQLKKVPAPSRKKKEL
jgi:hypothetical protein